LIAVTPSSAPPSGAAPSVTEPSKPPRTAVASVAPIEPANAAWHEAGDMVSAHGFHTSTLLGDGRVLVAGGLINDRLDGKVSAVAELYDPATDAWSATDVMTQARWGHTATLLADGKVLVAGSFVHGGDPLASAELYDPASGRWAAAERMHHGRGGHTATLLADGRVLVVGGAGEETELEGGPRSATAEVFDPQTGQWTVSASMSNARNGFTATLLPDGSVLVAGGDRGFAAAELFEPTTGKWAATGSMVEGRFGHTATLLVDGTVLVTGGCACSDLRGALESAERYDPATGVWTAAGTMSTGRIFHTATLLANGTVLVVNDGLSGDRPGSAEVYDPVSDRWVPTASPARSRSGYSATRLSDGKVLVAGGYEPHSQSTVEVYAPAGGS
jgi:N-acetylneuraminic acid mutarotase